MEQPIDLSVIIPMYNAEKYIRDTIASILQQEAHGLRVEIIVVDDCSTDQSRVVVEQLNLQVVRLILAPQNGGTAAARNLGIEHAKGTWIQFVDSDDRLGLDVYRKFEASIRSDYNCLLFSMIMEFRDYHLKLEITDVRDKRGFGHFGVVWNKFIKREICLPFRTEFSFEDVCWVVDMLREKDLKIGLIHDAYYIYNRMNTQSKMANFDGKAYVKMFDHIYQQIDTCDDLTKMYILETFDAILFERSLSLLLRLKIAGKTLFKLYPYVWQVYKNGIRHRVNKTIFAAQSSPNF